MGIRTQSYVRRSLPQGDPPPQPTTQPSHTPHENDKVEVPTVEGPGNPDLLDNNKKGKKTSSKKRTPNKRKQKGKAGKKKGKIDKTEKVAIENPNAENVEVPSGSNPIIDLSPVSIAPEVESSAIIIETPKDNANNGILKANNKTKKGRRIMMERTNKILERSRNVKKKPRKKSPVKPRVLPARASARLCVRKNSGDKRGRSTSDEPLRTVELIRRPLELRDAATKLLFLASLALYPTADPESDTTPIVIINEEIPASGGKKPKLRSMELPLLPNWKNANLFSPSSTTRASIEPISLSFRSTTSPSSTDSGTGIENPTKKKRAVKRKPVPKMAKVEENGESKQPEVRKKLAAKVRRRTKQNASKEGDEDVAVVVPQNLLINDAHHEQKIQNEMQMQLTKQKKAPKGNNKTIKLKTKEAVVENVEKMTIDANANTTATNIVKEQTDTTILKCPTLTLSQSSYKHGQILNVPLGKVNGKTATNNNNNNVFDLRREKFLDTTKLSDVDNSRKLSPHFREEKSPKSLIDSTIIKSLGIEAPTQTMQPIEVKIAVNKKRKSLETIIKEIPKKSNSLLIMAGFGKDSSSISQNGSQFASNPILEELMKNPIKKKQNKPKTQEFIQIPSSLPLSQASLQQLQEQQQHQQLSPISMTVPLQPAPVSVGNGITGGSPIVKEVATKPKSKQKQPKPKFQLPTPLPIPIPPGLLSYASLVPNNNAALPNIPKPKRQRKPRVPKQAKTFSLPQVQQNNNIKEKSQNNNNATLNIPYLPPHLEAFFHSLPTTTRNAEQEMLSSNAQYQQNSEEALDLCVKSQPPANIQPKKPRKPKAAAGTKSLLKPLNVEEDVPLNLVINRGNVVGPSPAMTKKLGHETKIKKDQEDNLENVKQMLARLHTNIAPAVNGVQLITIE